MKHPHALGTSVCMNVDMYGEVLHVGSFHTFFSVVTSRYVRNVTETSGSYFCQFQHNPPVLDANWDRRHHCNPP